MRTALTFVATRARLVFWYGGAPLALTALTFRYLVPSAAASASLAAPLRLLARVARDQPLVLAAAVFLLFSLLVGYWSAHLPGARPVERRPLSRRGTVLVVLAVTVAALAGVAVAQAFRPAGIVSTSMVPTILPGDRVCVDKLAFAADRPPRRGDVIVFRHSGDGEGEGGALVKRVIGIPGDHITMIDSHPVVNGVAVPSCDAGTFVYLGKSRVSRGRLAVEWLDGHAYLTVQDRGPHVFSGHDVEPGEVFVLGDNRGVSNDSRSWQGGAGVAFADIEGRVGRVLFGEDRHGRLDRGRLWTPLGTELHLPGVDLAPLRAGIERCLATSTAGAAATR